MTRDEALELLRRGGDDAVAIWNSWRGITWVRGHPQYAKDGPLLPRLNDANLAGVDLRGIDLTDADLSWTDLRGAKLQGSSFFGARLAYTDLREADFTRSEEHTSELQSLAYLVCRLLLEKKNTKNTITPRALFQSIDSPTDLRTSHYRF